MEPPHGLTSRRTSRIRWALTRYRSWQGSCSRRHTLEKAAAARSRDALIDELGFRRYLDYRVEALSGGTRQKLNLSLALMHDPQLLLLDEPYAGFDWETYLRFWEMAERRRAEGMGILIVSHLLAERERLTRIYELRDGRCEVAS